MSNPVECTVCMDTGWLRHYPGWSLSWTLEDFESSLAIQGPCNCSIGESIMRICKPYCDEKFTQQKRDRLYNAAKQGKKAKEHLNALILQKG